MGKDKKDSKGNQGKAEGDAPKKVDAPKVEAKDDKKVA
jgi:hypothetical protein